MRILIVRHGDPNYEIDSLTEKGWREAKLLSKRLCKMDIKDFYTSPLGRAKDTAKDTLEAMGREAKELPWLQEFFRANIARPDVKDGRAIVWDWLPQDWTKEPKYYDVNSWTDTEIMKDSTAAQEYKWVADGMDELLAEHGYVRKGNCYEVKERNRDTIVLFCHFGVQCVILSHLLNISPMVLWHGTVAAPTSVTTIYTEERREGIASLRVAAFGDISHLYVAEEEPAFSARFCETYDCQEERHD
ncbi:MAG: histidine phosphatase family protein [Eubacterium sp.]|nr:histidine phosphatase family protein [Eubacterium sp.]